MLIRLRGVLVCRECWFPLAEGFEGVACETACKQNTKEEVAGKLTFDEIQDHPKRQVITLSFAKVRQVPVLDLPQNRQRLLRFSDREPSLRQHDPRRVDLNLRRTPNIPQRILQCLEGGKGWRAVVSGNEGRERRDGVDVNRGRGR